MQKKYLSKFQKEGIHGNKKIVCSSVLFSDDEYFLTGTTYAISPGIDCAAGGCNVSYSSPDEFCFFEAKTEAQVSNDPAYNYPYGLFEFTIGNCSESILPALAGKVVTKGIASTTVTISFFDSSHNPIDMSGFIYRKYGPTTDKPFPHWYDFMYDGTTGAEIVGNVVTLHFVDGARGDDDLTLNSIIVDQGGPGQGAANIPTMTEWGMIIFVVLAGLGAVFFMRRQKTAKNQ